MRIELTPQEYAFAALAGFLRNVANVARGRRDAHGYQGDGYDVHVLGAVGEFVVSKALDIHWSGPGVLRAGDVGAIQVRTRSADHYDLIVHRDDDDAAAFVLVTGRFPVFTVRGWCYGREGKREEFWGDVGRNGRAAFFVPQIALRPAAELAALLAGA